MSRSDYLYRMGDNADRCYVVRSGVFKTVTVTGSGDEYVTGFFYPGELIGFSGQAEGRFPDSAVSLSNGTACRIRFRDLPRLWSLGAGPSFLRLIAEREQADTLVHINLGQKKAEVRIAGFLQQLMKRLSRLGFDPLCVPTPMSRTDLASHLGLTLESTSRVISRWKKAGVIETSRDQICIKQPDELATLAYHLFP